MPTYVMALTLSPFILDVLRDKGEVEGQYFLPCSLVVQEASMEDTYLEMSRRAYSLTTLHQSLIESLAKRLQGFFVTLRN